MSNLNIMQRVQMYAIHVITGNFDYINTCSIDLFILLRWAPLYGTCHCLNAVYMLEAIRGQHPRI